VVTCYNGPTVFVKDHTGAFVPCPKCNSVDVRYSDSIELRDLRFWLFGRKHAVRCRKCHERFYAKTNEAANKMWVD
jgi:transcriptional regulator NrdR family protein